MRKPSHTLSLPFIICGLLLVLNVAGNAQNSVEEISASNCGVNSVLALAHIQNREVPNSLKQELVNKYDRPSVSLLEVKVMAKTLGFELNGFKTTLEEVIRTDRPCILHLINPDHFVLFVDGDSRQIRFLESPDSTLEVTPIEEFKARFDGFALVSTVQPDSAAPRPVWDNKDMKVNVQGIGQEISHNFKVSNMGTQDLEVKVISTSCSCTSALLAEPDEKSSRSSLSIQPGKSAFVKVSYRATSAGNSRQAVVLKTNSSYRPIEILTLRGFMPQNVALTPSSLSFTAQKDEKIERELSLAGPPEMTLLEVGIDNSDWKVLPQIVENTPQRRVWKIQIIPLMSRVGEFKATLKIKTSYSQQPILTVPLSFARRGDLRFSPPSLFFGFIKPDELASRSFEISHIAKRPFKILSVDFTPPIEGIQAKVTSAQNSASPFRVSVNLRRNVFGLIQTNLLVKTDVSGEELIEVPVTAMIGDEASSPTPDATLLPRAEDDPKNEIAVAIPTVKAGDAAPDFTATDMNGKLWKLSDLKGRKNLLLTFFPKCFTGGCANHLSSLRDRQKEFDALDVQILAVSVDPADGEKGQKAFAAQWQLGFPLVPDASRSLSKLFGAAQTDKQLAACMSVFIDKTGVVRWVDTDVQVASHGADVLAKIQEQK